MSFRIATSGIVLALVAVGCGGESSPTMADEDRAMADLEIAAFQAESAGCQADMIRDGSCPEFELEQMVDGFLVTVRRLRADGFPEDELRDLLRDTANDLEGFCPVCVARLDRERESF